MSEPLAAGRVLDIRVAVEVLGWKPMYIKPGGNPVFDAPVDHGEPEDLDYYVTGKGHAPCGFSPSTDIADSWLVVKKLGLSVVHSEDGWYAIAPEDIEHGCVRGTAHPRLSLIGREHEHWTPAATAPLAICAAALEAPSSDSAVSGGPTVREEAQP